MEIPNKLGVQFVGEGNCEISSVSYSDGVLKINQFQSFINVREDIWDFCFGGYHGLQKWFKDRRGTVLSEKDIQHVIRVFNVFDETETIMAEIDSIDEYFC